jgi:type I restriction enzyme S subunit
MESGHTPSREHPEYWAGEIPWVGIADARDGHGRTVAETYQHTNNLGLANSAARLLPAGTVCLSRTASVGYVLRMGKPMATSQDFANWSCTSAVNPDWLKFLFVAETKAIYRFGKGSTHTTVYYPELLAFHVALPPIEEQAEVVRRVEILFALADRLEARVATARAKIDTLTPATLAKAFRGELVPQDPNDEPASVLLERIQAERATPGSSNIKTRRRPATSTSARVSKLGKN